MAGLIPATGLPTGPARWDLCSVAVVDTGQPLQGADRDDNPATEPDRGNLAIRLAAETGARRAELAAMRWDDVIDGQLVIGAKAVGVSGRATGSWQSGRGRRALFVSC